MNTNLKEIIEVISRLPDDQQEELAAAIRLELETAHKWDETFGKSPGLLHRLAESAMDEYRAGKTEPLDPDRL